MRHRLQATPPSNSRRIRARRPHGHIKNDQDPPLGQRNSDSPTVNSCSPSLTVTTFIASVMSPGARSLDTEIPGSSAYAAFIIAEIALAERSPKSCAFGVLGSLPFARSNRAHLD